MMTQAEGQAALVRYQQTHLKAWERLRSAIEQAVGHPVDALPMVELTLTGS